MQNDRKQQEDSERERLMDIGRNGKRDQNKTKKEKQETEKITRVQDRQRM